jgi:hypothetical protein
MGLKILFILVLLNGLLCVPLNASVLCHNRVQSLAALIQRHAKFPVEFSDNQTENRISDLLNLIAEKAKNDTEISNEQVLNLFIDLGKYLRSIGVQVKPEIKSRQLVFLPSTDLSFGKLLWELAEVFPGVKFVFDLNRYLEMGPGSVRASVFEDGTFYLDPQDFMGTIYDIDGQERTRLLSIHHLSPWIGEIASRMTSNQDTLATSLLRMRYRRPIDPVNPHERRSLLEFYFKLASLKYALQIFQERKIFRGSVFAIETASLVNDLIAEWRLIADSIFGLKHRIQNPGTRMFDIESSDTRVFQLVLDSNNSGGQNAVGFTWEFSPDHGTIQVKPADHNLASLEFPFSSVQINKDLYPLVSDYFLARSLGFPVGPQRDQILSNLEIHLAAVFEAASKLDRAVAQPLEDIKTAFDHYLNGLKEKPDISPSVLDPALAL